VITIREKPVLEKARSTSNGNDIGTIVSIQQFLLALRARFACLAMLLAATVLAATGVSFLLPKTYRGDGVAAGGVQGRAIAEQCPHP